MAMSSHFSLKLTAEGIQKAKLSLIQKKINRGRLAKLLHISISTIDRFYAGRTVSPDVFVRLCEYLDLDWEDTDISDIPKLKEAKAELQDRYLDLLRGITPKPRKVLLLLLENKTDDEIAAALTCTPATVRKHVQNLCDHFRIKKEVDGLQRNRREDLIEYFRSKVDKDS